MWAWGLCPQQSLRPFFRQWNIHECPGCSMFPRNWHCSASQQTEPLACGRAYASVREERGSIRSTPSAPPQWLDVSPSNAPRLIWDSLRWPSNTRIDATLCSSSRRSKAAWQSLCVCQSQSFGKTCPTLPVWQRFGKARCLAGYRSLPRSRTASASSGTLQLPAYRPRVEL